MIYFDNAATTYPKPEEVYLALDKANREFAFNSGRGSYKEAKNSSKIISETRNAIASLADARAEDVIFTHSATEALNDIIFGMDWKQGDNVYVSPFEHNAIMRPLHQIKNEYDININIIPFNKLTWDIEKETLEDMFILNKPKCIFCSAKSNVTGYNIPYKEIFKLGKEYNSINILDASQSFGVNKEIKKSKYIDFIVFAGHKSLYASFGVAGFLNFKDNLLKSYIIGGTGSDSLNFNMPPNSPDKYESGSKNVVAIYSLHESIKWIEKIDVNSKERMLLSYFYDKIKENDRIIKYIPSEITKCSGIISINIEGYTAEEIGELLDAKDICVRTGYHCAPLVHDFINSRPYFGTVRISFNYFNTTEEIDKLLEILNSL